MSATHQGRLRAGLFSFLPDPYSVRRLGWCFKRGTWVCPCCCSLDPRDEASRLYFHDVSVHTSVSKLSEPLGLVSGPPREVFTERDRLFPSRGLPYIATHTGGSHAFAF